MDYKTEYEKLLAEHEQLKRHDELQRVTLIYLFRLLEDAPTTIIRKWFNLRLQYMICALFEHDVIKTYGARYNQAEMYILSGKDVTRIFDE